MKTYLPRCRRKYIACRHIMLSCHHTELVSSMLAVTCGQYLVNNFNLIALYFEVTCIQNVLPSYIFELRIIHGNALLLSKDYLKRACF